LYNLITLQYLIYT